MTALKQKLSKYIVDHKLNPNSFGRKADISPGIITNIINIIIFSKKSLKVIIFKYCRINAIFQIFVIF